MLTLITPTSDRPRAFELCEHWMARQTYTGPLHWIVVDDGQQKVECTRGQDHVHRPPGEDAATSFRNNLLAGLRRAAAFGAQRICVIEDDDWYAPGYLRQMAEWLEHRDLAGEGNARYYHVPTGHYRTMGNRRHASLCQTGFSGPVLPWMIGHLESDEQTTAVDMRVWRAAGYWRAHLEPNTSLSCGIKGLPGRKGIGVGHRPHDGLPIDRDGEILRRWVGDDAAWYRPSIVVYTALFGDRDTLLPATDASVPHICISDRERSIEGWQTLQIGRLSDSPRRDARRIKATGHQWLPEADVTVWRDANIDLQVPAGELVARHLMGREIAAFSHPRRNCIYMEAEVCTRENRDVGSVIRRQAERYRAAGFPERFGLHETGVLLRRNIPAVWQFNAAWWQEIEQGSLRDQLSFDFVRWRTGQRVESMGANMRESPDVRLRRHTGPYRARQEA